VEFGEEIKPRRGKERLLKLKKKKKKKKFWPFGEAEPPLGQMGVVRPPSKLALWVAEPPLEFFYFIF